MGRVLDWEGSEVEEKMDFGGTITVIGCGDLEGEFRPGR